MSQRLGTDESLDVNVFLAEGSQGLAFQPGKKGSYKGLAKLLWGPTEEALRERALTVMAVAPSNRPQLLQSLKAEMQTEYPSSAKEIRVLTGTLWSMVGMLEMGAVSEEEGEVTEAIVNQTVIVLQESGLFPKARKL